MHVKFAVKWLPARRVVATCFIVIGSENPDGRIFVPCPVPSRLLPSHLPPFVQPCRSLRTVPWSIHYLLLRHVRYRLFSEFVLAAHYRLCQILFCLFSEFLPAAHHKF